MQKIITEICAVSASRKYDLKLMNQSGSGCKSNEIHLNIEEFLTREKVRADKQKINFMVLRKNKQLDSEARQQILYMLFQMISNIDQEIYNQIKYEVYSDIISDEIPQFGDLGINDLLQMIDKFAAAFKIKNQKLKTITRPNNPNILIDFVELVSRVAKQKLKQAIFGLNDMLPVIKTVSKQDNNFNMSHKREETLIKLRIRRMQTQITQTIKKNPSNRQLVPIRNSIKKQKSAKNLRRKQFQRQHKDYMLEKRRQFLIKFQISEYEDKVNNIYVQMLQLNEINQGIISKYRSKSFYRDKSPKLRLKMCQVDLYSNSQKKSKIEKANRDLKQIMDIESMPTLGASSSQFKDYRGLYLQRANQFNNIKANGLEKQEDNQVNSWFFLIIKLTNHLQYPLKIYFPEKMEQKKSIQLLSQELLRLANSDSLFSSTQPQMSNQTDDNDLRKFSNQNLPPTKQPIQNDIRHSTGSNTTIKTTGTSRFRREIVGCFSRKRIKQLLQSTRISPTKKVNLSGQVQKSNTTLILPYLPSNGNIISSQNDSKQIRQVDSTIKQLNQKKTEENGSLNEMLVKKMQQQKSDNSYQVVKKQRQQNQALKIACSIIQF